MAALTTPTDEIGGQLYPRDYTQYLNCDEPAQNPICGLADAAASTQGNLPMDQTNANTSHLQAKRRRTDNDDRRCSSNERAVAKKALEEFSEFHDQKLRELISKGCKLLLTHGKGLYNDEVREITGQISSWGHDLGP